jgi:N4-gp56 family major capsid protein
LVAKLNQPRAKTKAITITDKVAASNDRAFSASIPTANPANNATSTSTLCVQPGRTINIPRYGNIKRGGALVEGVRMKTQAMSMSQQSISVVEYGNAIGFSEYLLQTSFYDQLSAASLLLGRDMAVVLDLALRGAIMGGVQVIFGGGKASRGSVTSTDTFSTQTIKDAVETLQTNNSPMWGGDHYICFLHPHQARSLRDDNDWINAAQYSGATQIYTGEIGRYEDVRFISTTVMPNGKNSNVDPVTGDYSDIGYDPSLDSAGAGGIAIYQAVFFGEYSCGHATALPVELRDNGVEDFGREHGLAWYAIFGQSILEGKNIVVAETA